MNACRAQYESSIRKYVSNPISDPMNHQTVISQKQNSLPIRTGCVSSPMPIADLALSTPVGEAMGADIPRTDPCGSHLKFPFRLHRILSEAEHLGFDHVIAWTSAGDGFRVFEPKIFA
ncbi:hypothetical protein IV203_004369 [Nitzschia inconspicua]|uniref:HSF-type DNA-binding domain-containing protein n=1 Tax=Nitzschia inconspicua TaxID=303405 RepID=A0A9K3L3G3_9STRA|nr:hypothetical protein IV203_004369 [Nitzschia inconspicua]